MQVLTNIKTIKHVHLIIYYIEAGETNELKHIEKISARYTHRKKVCDFLRI